MFPLHDNNPITRWPVVTVLLIVANVVSFLYMLQLPHNAQQQLVITRGFIPASIEQLSNPNLVIQVETQQQVQGPLPNQVMLVQKKVPLAADPSRTYLSLLTTMFLHGGWLHLIGNMWFLWLFGNNVEDRLGHVLYLAFYLLGGLLATASHWAFDPTSTTPVIGASGAVSAILGAYAITYPHARVKTLIFLFVFVTIIEMPAMVLLGLWLLVQVVSAMGVIGAQAGRVAPEAANVAWWAHIGGFAAGMILMPMLSAGVPPPGTDWNKEADRFFQ